MNVSVKTALITGAGSGIGRGIACALAKRGCHVALADVDTAGLKETAAMVQPYGTRISTHRLDVRSREAVQALPAAIVQEHGELHLLVNNAGIAAGGTFLQVNEEVFDRVIDTNFLAIVRITRTFLPLLLQQQEARIVNISSVYGLIAPVEQTAYAASKFAVRGFSNALRHELESGPVGVTVVHPGGIATRIAENATFPDSLSEAEIRKRLAISRKVLRMSPERAGEIIVRGIERNKARIIMGADAKLLSVLERLMPVHYWKVLKVLIRMTER